MSRGEKGELVETEKVAQMTQLVLRRRGGSDPFRFRAGQAAALFFLGFATHALLTTDVRVFLIFFVVAALAAAWDAGWRVLVRQGPPSGGGSSPSG
jgi:hypothetical protein